MEETGLISCMTSLVVARDIMLCARRLVLLSAVKPIVCSR